jgi:excisionase family DNA binding protein
VNGDLIELPEKLLTAADIAAQLGVSDKWVYKAAKDEKLKSVQVGRYVRFRAVDVQEWIESGGAR